MHSILFGRTVLIEPAPLFAYLDARFAVESGRSPLPLDGPMLRAVFYHAPELPKLFNRWEDTAARALLSPFKGELASVWASMVLRRYGFHLPVEAYAFDGIRALLGASGDTDPAETEWLFTLRKELVDIGESILDQNTIAGIFSVIQKLSFSDRESYEIAVDLSRYYRPGRCSDERSWALMTSSRTRVLRSMCGGELPRKPAQLFSLVMSLGDTYAFKGFLWRQLVAYDVAKAMTGYAVVTPTLMSYS